MLRTRVITGLLAGLALLGCNRSAHQGKGVAGISALSGMIADPARELVYLGDANTGRIVGLSTRDGTTQRVLDLGVSIGGLAMDDCVQKIYVSVTSANRIDVIDGDSFQRTASLRLNTKPYAIAYAKNDHLVLVTTRGLLDLDPATLRTRTLLAHIEPHALIATNRAGNLIYVVESENGLAQVARYDLDVPGDAPVMTTPGALIGTHVGINLTFTEDRLFVATDGPDGVYQLDATSLAPTGTLPIGPDLAAITLNGPSTRLYYSHGDLVLDSINLDVFAHGSSFFTDTDVRDRGLLVASNGLSLLSFEQNRSVQSYFLFDTHLNAPAAVRQGETYLAVIEGPPGGAYYLFGSADPGYIYLDPPSSFDPRFLDLALGAGFQVLFFGRFDVTGHALIRGTVPTDYINEQTLLIQAVAQNRPGRAFAEVSNPIMIRFLAPDCVDPNPNP